ncbi:hypothetical protein OH76DRAFT_1422097 [Lentinus brumalis]|uniref:Uncharacterized protein n=1 Tax=Lentinus brumalis TaxID=2498619 RepID=A0A371CSD2_9APHY|nr:hypothetical protein OH76DRAFT_1422097 [Polyporus brumalis]
MSTTKNVRNGARTSNEAAATSVSSWDQPRTDGVLEGSGPPLFATSDLELSVKWGMRDYGRIVEETGGRRVTQTYAGTVRTGDSVSAQPASGRYRGHREMRELNSASGPRPGAQWRRDGSPAPPENMRRDGSILRDQNEPRHVGSAQVEQRRNGSEPTVPESRRDGCNSDEMTVLRLLDIEDETPRDGGVSGPESTLRDEDRLALVLTQQSSSPTTNWYELCEAEDQLGQLPTSWECSTLHVPMLPQVIQSKQSFVDDFWREVESSSSETEDDDDYELQQAIAALIITLQGDSIERLKLEEQGLEAMAVIVEIAPEAPAGRDGRYTSSQKVKSVPRDDTPREFLRQFVQNEAGSSHMRPSSHKTSSRHTKHTTTPLSGGHPSPSPAHAPPRSPSVFRRESSQMPDGGWFRHSTAAGGREPPGGPPPSSSSEADDSSSESSSSSDSSESSSSSSDTSSSSEQGHAKPTKQSAKQDKEDLKQMKRAMSGVKIKTPFIWNGSPDLDVLDQWTYEVDTWHELHGLSVKTVRAGTKSGGSPDGVTELRSPEQDALRVKTSAKLLINALRIHEGLQFKTDKRTGVYTGASNE